MSDPIPHAQVLAVDTEDSVIRLTTAFGEGNPGKLAALAGPLLGKVVELVPRGRVGELEYLLQGEIDAHTETSTLLTAAERERDNLLRQNEMLLADLSAPALAIIKERRRQREEEGHWLADDDRYRDGQLARAAAAYVLAVSDDRQPVPGMWPWADDLFKPRGLRSNLIRAGALILAELERLDRAAARPAGDAFEGLPVEDGAASGADEKLPPSAVPSLNPSTEQP